MIWVLIVVIPLIVVVAVHMGHAIRPLRDKDGKRLEFAPPEEKKARGVYMLGNRGIGA